MANVSQTPQSPDPAAPAPLPRKKRRRGLIIFISIMVLLAAGEIGLRIFAARDSKFQARLGAEKEFDPYRRTRWRKDYHMGDFNTNSRGFPGPEFTDKKSPGTYRIVCLGDSASVIPPIHPYPRALEEHLRKLLPDRKIDVIEAACSGYDSRQARVWYEREVNDIEHDMLLIYLGWNDMGQYNPDGLVYKREEVGMLKAPTLFEKMILNIYLLRSLYVIQGYIERAQALSFEPLTGDDLKTYSEFYPQHFEDNLKTVIGLAKAKGRIVRMLNYGGLVVENPTPEEQPKIHFPRGMGRRMPKYLALLNAYKKVLQKVSIETNTPIIDVETFFSDPKNRTVFTDSAHFTTEGADMFAEIVSKAVVKEIK
jgi:lysophospholipase L1-like esterase